MRWVLLLATLGVSSCSEFAVAAYLPEWRYEGANWKVISRHVSHLILFSLEPLTDGGIGALDRIPRPEILAQARQAASLHDAYLMLCFGGNGRSNGFSGMVRSEDTRARFVGELVRLLEEHRFDGVDYNWEYPGYEFGRGYLSDSQVKADYDGLLALFKETRAALGASQQITMSYYPDSRQEQILADLRAYDYLDYMFAMSYDQGGPQHSPMELAVKTVSQVRKASLPTSQMCLGLPFYGRSRSTGDWKSYEDLVQQHHPLEPDADQRDGQGFNGAATIAAKTKLAIESGFGGVMIWEVGQDCRLEPVTHGPKTHPVTCPNGDESSLLFAISRTLASMNQKLVSSKKNRRPDEL